MERREAGRKRKGWEDIVWRREEVGNTETTTHGSTMESNNAGAMATTLPQGHRRQQRSLICTTRIGPGESQRRRNKTKTTSHRHTQPVAQAGGDRGGYEYIDRANVVGRATYTMRMNTYKRRRRRHWRGATADIMIATAEAIGEILHRERHTEAK